MYLSTDTISPAAICAAIQTPDEADSITKSNTRSPRQVPHWSSGHVPLAPYRPTEEVTAICDEIRNLHKLRQGMIRAQTKLALQAQAVLRLAFASDDDFATEEGKAKARKRTESLYRTVKDDESHPLYPSVLPFLMMLKAGDPARLAYEKALVKAAKRLPVYAWVKNVKGLGDISFATIVGECGDIGSYKSVSAVWKRMGVAVMDGRRQGNPGAGAAAEDWTAHGYNKQRRSVGYVAREHVIGGMGKWRPVMGEDVDANEALTPYQRAYACRARVEAEKLGLPVTEADTGKESYKKHVSSRAHRYVEKMLLKHLYIEWRRH